MSSTIASDSSQPAFYTSAKLFLSTSSSNLSSARTSEMDIFNKSFQGNLTSTLFPNLTAGLFQNLITKIFQNVTVDPFHNLTTEMFQNLTDYPFHNLTDSFHSLSTAWHPHPRVLADSSVREDPEGTASSPQAVVLLSILFCIIGTIGIVGNVMIVAVIARDRKLRRSVTNLFIINLAVADFCGTLFAVPEILQFMMNRGWVLGLGLCKTNRFILVWSLYSSILTLMAISVERYVAIIHPIHARIACSRRRTLTAIGVIWPTAALCGLPTLLFNDVVTQPPANTIPLCKIVLPGEQMEGNAAFRITESLLFFFLPVLLQLGLYTLVIRRLFARSSILQAQIDIELGRHGTLRRHRGRRRPGGETIGEVSEAFDRDSSSGSKNHFSGSDNTLTNIPEEHTSKTEVSSLGSYTRGFYLCCLSGSETNRSLNLDHQTGDWSNFDSHSHATSESSSNSRTCCEDHCSWSAFRCRRSTRKVPDGETQPDERCNSTRIRIAFSDAWNRMCYRTMGTNAPIDTPHRSPTQEALRTRQGVIKMLVATLLVYIISYAPLQVPTFYNLTASVPFQVSWTFVVMVMILTYINSAVNPLLYAIFSQNFRRHFIKLLLCNRPEGPDPLRTDIFSASRLLRRELEEGAASRRNGTMSIKEYTGSIRRGRFGEDLSNESKSQDSFRNSNRRSVYDNTIQHNADLTSVLSYNDDIRGNKEQPQRRDKIEAIASTQRRSIESAKYSANEDENQDFCRNRNKRSVYDNVKPTERRKPAAREQETRNNEIAPQRQNVQISPRNSQAAEIGHGNVTRRGRFGSADKYCSADRYGNANIPQNVDKQYPDIRLIQEKDGNNQLLPPTALRDRNDKKSRTGKAVSWAV